MAEDRLPARYQNHTAAPSSDRLPTRGVSDAPIHRPKELSFGGSAATREELWQRLSPTLHEKVNQRLGRLLQWWATEVDERVSAVALGTRALIVLSPTVNQAGRPATEINTINLDEASFRSASVTETHGATPPGMAHVSQTAPPREPGSPPHQRPAPTPALTHHVDHNVSGFLGQLPTRAQQLLQDPFLNASDELRYDYFYYRTGHGHNIGGATLYVWCYFTDLRTVTFCAGHGRDYQTPRGPASWELTCWRADVAPRSRGTSQ